MIFSNFSYFTSIDWNKDFKPGPLPTNEEERRAAAKKYGLLPEEYKTYENDGKTPKKHTLLDIIFVHQLTIFSCHQQKNRSKSFFHCMFLLSVWVNFRCWLWWLSTVRGKTNWTERCLLSIWFSRNETEFPRASKLFVCHVFFGIKRRLPNGNTSQFMQLSSLNSPYSSQTNCFFLFRFMPKSISTMKHVWERQHRSVFHSRYNQNKTENPNFCSHNRKYSLRPHQK